MPVGLLLFVVVATTAQAALAASAEPRGAGSVHLALILERADRPEVLLSGFSKSESIAE